jgi:hypothetical protein
VSAVGNALIERGEEVMRERGFSHEDQVAWDAIMEELMSPPPRSFAYSVAIAGGRNTYQAGCRLCDWRGEVMGGYYGEAFMRCYFASTEHREVEHPLDSPSKPDGALF